MNKRVVVDPYEVLKEMKVRSAWHAVYGLVFDSHTVCAETVKEVYYFGTNKEFLEWCDLIPKIYDRHTPSVILAVHRVL